MNSPQHLSQDDETEFPRAALGYIDGVLKTTASASGAGRGNHTCATVFLYR